MGKGNFEVRYFIEEKEKQMPVYASLNESIFLSFTRSQFTLIHEKRLKRESAFVELLTPSQALHLGYILSVHLAVTLGRSTGPECTFK